MKNALYILSTFLLLLTLPLHTHTAYNSLVEQNITVIHDPLIEDPKPNLLKNSANSCIFTPTLAQETILKKFVICLAISEVDAPEDQTCLTEKILRNSKYLRDLQSSMNVKLMINPEVIERLSKDYEQAKDQEKHKRSFVTLTPVKSINGQLLFINGQLVPDTKQTIIHAQRTDDPTKVIFPHGVQAYACYMIPNQPSNTF